MLIFQGVTLFYIPKKYMEILYSKEVKKYMGIYLKKKPRPFDHTFGADRITKTQKSLWFCMRWMGFAEILTRARAKRKGSYHTKMIKEFSTTPTWYNTTLFMYI